MSIWNIFEFRTRFLVRRLLKYLSRIEFKFINPEYLRYSLPTISPESFWISFQSVYGQSCHLFSTIFNHSTAASLPEWWTCHIWKRLPPPPPCLKNRVHRTPKYGLRIVRAMNRAEKVISSEQSIFSEHPKWPPLEVLVYRFRWIKSELYIHG